MSIDFQIKNRLQLAKKLQDPAFQAKAVIGGVIKRLMDADFVNIYKTGTRSIKAYNSGKTFRDDKKVAEVNQFLAQRDVEAVMKRHGIKQSWNQTKHAFICRLK